MFNQKDVVAYIIVDEFTGKFVGQDDSSGGYPWKSDKLEYGSMLWPTYELALHYKNIEGFKREPFNSSKWTVKRLVIANLE